MSHPFPMRRLLLPLVPLYRLGLAIREWQLRWRPPQRLSRPVVSIGNLSTGGSGKTPLAIALIKALARRGSQVDVLSRGYGRNSCAALRVDPSGLADLYGDEPLLIARDGGVPVYVASQRYEAGLLAEQQGDAGIHLLDDGFQHRQLHRDVDVLLVTASDLADRLLPAGDLREPLSALSRADVVAISTAEPGLEAKIRARGWTGPIWRLRRTMDVPAIAGPVVAFCGIARPGQFFEGLAAAGINVASRVAFRDHHRYVQHDLDCLMDAARNVSATAFITTEKDLVRMGPLVASLALPLQTAKLSIEIEDESASLDWLLNKVC
jgi:tetraacyldisaccharide 4'-kinase